jgi:hypothetical protein
MDLSGSVVYDKQYIVKSLQEANKEHSKLTRINEETSFLK